MDLQFLINTPDNKLPYGLYHPDTEGKLLWLCNYDADNKITSVFTMDLGDHKEKKCDYLASEEEAIKYRDTLLGEGWKPIEMPEIVCNYPDGMGNNIKKPLNRKQKRALAKKIKKMSKQNPFE